MKLFKLYSPLILVESYLLFTLFLFFWGPVFWPLENKSKFIFLVSLYHAFFILGYVLCCRISLRKDLLVKPLVGEVEDGKNIFLRFFWVILPLALIAMVILHRNITLSKSYVSLEFFSGLSRGLLAPVEARAFYASEAAKNGFEANPYVTAILIFVGVFKYVLLPGLVFYWPRLSVGKKIAGGLVVIIPLFTGVIASLSAINFYYLFVVSICLTGVLVSSNSAGFFVELGRRKAVLVFLVFIFIFSFWQFYSVKSGASPYEVAFENQRPGSFSYLNEKGVLFKSELGGGEKSNVTDFYEKLTVYLVQGYQGFSIALGEKFETSFGIGHSVFLQRIFAGHLGLDVTSRTFQHKITERWDENVYWHSFYSYIANDVGFLGVSVVLLILGAYFAKVYISVVISGDFFAKMLLPLFGIMFLYFPANNQVFGFLESMLSFWILTVFFIFHRRHSAVQSDDTGHRGSYV